MASNLAPLSPAPPPQEPMVDIKTGQVTTTWYAYLKRLDEHLRDAERRITDLEP